MWARNGAAMNCLILGGAGFIGSHTVDALLTRGHSVRVFDRLNVDTSNLVDALPHIELCRGDFLNETDMSHALQGIDLVLHCISTTLPQTSNENPVYDVESNVVGTLRLLQLACQHGVNRIVFLSSGGTVYGSSVKCPISEADPTDPICSYGISKLAIEKYLHLFYHLHDLDYVVLRVANPFGERQNPTSGQGAVPAFLWRLLRGEPISIWGDGTVARDYLYISDLIAAIVAVIEGQTPSKIYNIGSGVALSLSELLAIMEAVTGRAPVIRYSPARKLDVPVTCFDISRAQKELHWQPRIPIEEGMARTWGWLKGR
jgi:UDP-glucose 4-epimerase